MAVMISNIIPVKAIIPNVSPYLSRSLKFLMHKIIPITQAIASITNKIIKNVIIKMFISIYKFI